MFVFKGRDRDLAKVMFSTKRLKADVMQMVAWLMESGWSRGSG
jgi:hypothetical protein